jgi:hypothetical protein
MAIARQRRRKAQQDAWAVDQLDADNWFRIPEFGVKPEEVQFEGFAFPIVSPYMDHYEARQSVRNLVRVARQLIVREVSTVLEAKMEAIGALEALDTGKSPTGRQAASLIYGYVVRGLEGAFSDFGDEHSRFEALAGNAATIAQWASGEIGSAMRGMGKAERAHMQAIAKQPRPAARKHDHDELLAKFDRYMAAGHTARETRGLLVASGQYGSQSHIHRVTKEK